MSERPTLGDEVLPPSLEGRVDAICDRFEAAWKEGRRPVIVDYLAEVPETDRSAVMAELIALDVEYRLRARESATAEDYRDRFAASSQTERPSLPPKVASGLEKASGTDSLSSQLPKTENSPVEGWIGGAAPTAGGDDLQFSGPSGVITSDADSEKAGDTGKTRRRDHPSNTPADKVATPSSWPEVPGYRILGELGRGGMGVVYKAEQLALKRVVAMKVVLAGAFANPKKLIRFRIEAEAVARLLHPNIVQIYEIGEYKKLPYFTLEYVDGGSLASKRAEPPRSSAEMVRTLALAIHAAHQRGILHRDLKPANVLLTSSGLPKITDFGLAKQLDQESGHTQTGDIMGTPSYMAPEQAAGKTKELGVWTDVYALGAILYEMLTGMPPFKGRSILDTLFMVRTQDPVPPGQLQPKTARDLEVICLKCLEKEPAKRYPSAEAMADDLRRYLAGEPILARPTTAWERAVRWARRRPAVVALIGLAALTLVGSVAGALAFARHEFARAEEADALRKTAERERSRAEENFLHARDAVDQMLTGVSRDRLAFEPRMEQVRRELLYKALQYYQRFLDVKSDLPAVRWEAGRAYQRVGDIQELLGQHAESESAYRAALGLLGDLAERFPVQADYRHDLAAAHTNLGNLLKKVGRFTEAEQAYQSALDLHSQLAQNDPQSPELRRALAAAYTNRAALRQARNQLPDADRDYLRALEVFTALVASHPRVPDYREEFARCLNNHGTLQQTQGQTEGADGQYVRALDLFRLLAIEYPAVPAYRQQQAVTLTHLANLKRDTSLPEAEAAFRQALSLREALANDFPSIPVYRQELADTYMNLALMKGAGRNAEADQTYLNSLKVKAALVADFAKVPGFRRDLATSYSTWGILLQLHRRLPEAAKAYQQGLDILAKLIAEFPGETDYRQDEATTLNNLGTLQQLMNQPGDAEKSYRRALEVRQVLADQFGQLPDHQQELARAHLNLGTLLQINNQPAKAETAYRDAATILEKLAKTYPTVPDYRHEVTVCYNNLGNLLQATQRAQEAEWFWRQAVDILARMIQDMPKVPAYRQEQARTLNQLAILLASTARGPEAGRLWNQALKIQEDLVKEFPDRADYRLELARSAGNLGVAQLSDNPPNQAEIQFDRAIKILEELAKDPATGRQYWQELSVHHFNRASLLHQLGRREAEQSWKRAESLQRQLVKAFPKAPEHLASLAQTLNTRARLWLKEENLQESRQSFQEALELFKTALQQSPGQPRYRQGILESGLGLAEVHLALKDHGGAVRVVEEVTKIAPSQGNEPPRSAVILVRSMSLASNDATLAEAKRKELARQYEDRAMELLHLAIVGGFQDAAYLKKAAELAPLRARADFQKLVENLEAKQRKP